MTNLKVADYQCECEDGYGGKNCSVQLLGCIGVQCLNGGTCTALLYDEIQHDHRCDCIPGFTGEECELKTTMSLSGQSYLIIYSDNGQGKDYFYE